MARWLGSNLWLPGYSLCMDTSPQAVARRARIEKWFWIFNLPVCVVLYFALSAKIMGLYIALVSVHALVKTCATEEQAAEAREAIDSTCEN